jgi:TPR repeat protein
VKWWRKAAEAGESGAQWCMGQSYFYGRGVSQDVAQARVRFRKAAAQGDTEAAEAVQTGIPGHVVQGGIVRFTNAGFAPTRYAAAHQLAKAG